MAQIATSPHAPSETPILDLLQPLPRRHRTSLLRFALAFLGGVILVVLMFDFRLPTLWAPLSTLGKAFLSAFGFWDHQFLLGGLLALWTAIVFAIFVHELAHFLVGRMVGFSLQSLQVGPIVFAFEHGTLKVRFQAASTLSGFTSMQVDRVSRFRHKLIRYIAAGPGGSLLCAGVATLTLRANLGINAHPYLSSTVQLFAFASFWCFACSVIPYRSVSGHFSDGSRLRMLLSPSVATRRWYAVMGIGILQRSGRHPRDWNRRWLDVASRAWDNSKDALLGTWLAYAAASDRKDDPVAGTWKQSYVGAQGYGGRFEILS